MRFLKWFLLLITGAIVMTLAQKCLRIPDNLGSTLNWKFQGISITACIYDVITMIWGYIFITFGNDILLRGNKNAN